jgi:hypothetical protein
MLDELIQKMNALQDFSPTIGPKEYGNAKKRLEQKRPELTRESTQVTSNQIPLGT